MLEGYLIVEKDVLPDYFIKVVEARRLLESGECSQVSDAVRAVGISRSTYYKYRDKVIEPSNLTVGRKASLMLRLNHEAGMLSKVMGAISTYSANILTITQSLPIHEKANLMLTIDMAQMSAPVEDMLKALEGIRGVEHVKLLAIE